MALKVSGLGAIEQFKRKGFKVAAYDARDSVGGLWNFDPSPPPCKITFDSNGFAVALSEAEHQGLPVPPPTPMYAGVTANTPRDIMPYRSHPYPDGTAEYPTYKVIKAYQDGHAASHTELIHLNRVVTRVRHAPDYGLRAGAKRWLVEWTPSWTSTSPDKGKTIQDSFDHVVVANGTDSRPYIPYIDGLWDWKGDILHSRWYRRAEAFAGKVVLLVGGGPSSESAGTRTMAGTDEAGADIVRELGLLSVAGSPAAPHKIYRSIRSTTLRYDTEHDKGWPFHVQNVAPMRIVHPPSASSVHGRIETLAGELLDDVDVIIFATAYTARFEFCRPTDAPFDQHPVTRTLRTPAANRKPDASQIGTSVLEGGHRVHNLDAHQLFYLPDPTLAFLLLHAEAIPWPFAEMQARVVAAVWSGTEFELTPDPHEDSESHSTLVLGHPGEWVVTPAALVKELLLMQRFEYAERLLRLIGEGGPEEVDAEGRWGQWPAWKKHIRALID